MSDDDVEMDKLVSLQVLDASLNAQMSLMINFASARGLSEHPLLKRLFDDMATAHVGLTGDIHRRADEAYRRDRSKA